MNDDDSSGDEVFYVGKRLSLKGQLCTVRHVGPVASKSGEWLGVEWDDPARGKNDGSHEGQQYFKCTGPVS
jgi:tubulin-specific chaperone E